MDYMVSLVGPEHVGLGTDYVPDLRYDRDAFSKRMAEAGDQHWPPPGIGWARPAGQRLIDENTAEGSSVQPEQLFEIVETMLAHGYSTESVKSIVGANFKRVYATL